MTARTKQSTRCAQPVIMTMPSGGRGVESAQESSSETPPLTKVRPVRIEEIRTDGDTQHRVLMNECVIRQYAELMAGGIQLPPVSIWYDGEYYWLSDGFHRLAAAQLMNWRKIGALIRNGNLNDARWDSYRANSDHGLRRTRRDLEIVIRRALSHPHAAQLSNVDIAKHLNIPETTLRRWRKRLSSSYGEDSTRVVSRGASTYAIDTARIGMARRPQQAKSLKVVGAELSEMKQHGSPDARRFFSVLTKWIQGSAGTDDCLRAIENIIKDLKGKSSKQNRNAYEPLSNGESSVGAVGE
jgi:hypothetical protein